MFKKIVMLLLVCTMVVACDSKDAEQKAKEQDEAVAEVVNQTESGEAPAEQFEMVGESVQSFNGNVEDHYRRWLNEVAVPALKQKCVQKGIDLTEPECTEDVFHYGDAIVAGSPQDANWEDLRIGAYQKALAEAYQKVVRSLGLNNEIKLLSSFFEDDEKLEPGQDVKSTIEVLFDKVLALAGGKLDSKLREYGIDPEQFNSAKDSVKKEMLRDAIAVQSIKSAVADISGMIPCKNFEGKSQNGQYIIRVVISEDRDKIAFIKSMLLKQARIMPDPDKKSDKKLVERLILDPSVLVYQFAPRLMYDEQGYPCLVAFGQANIKSAASMKRRASSVRSAHIRAVDMADYSLSILLNSQASYKAVVRQALKHLEAEQLISGNVVAAVPDADINTKYTDLTMDISAQIDSFAGLAEIHDWTYQWPKTRNETTGVIMVWKPQLALMAEKVKAAQKNPVVQKPEIQQPKAQEPASKAEVANEVIPDVVIEGIDGDF